jgi:hypothetical protein
MWQEMRNIQASGVCLSYLDAIDIWINKPHVVNRHLCGAKILWQHHSNGRTVDHPGDMHSTEILDSSMPQVEQKELIEFVCAFPKQLGVDGTKEIKIYLRDLLPKALDKFAVLREIVVVGTYEYSRNVVVVSLVGMYTGIVVIPPPRP